MTLQKAGIYKLKRNEMAGIVFSSNIKTIVMTTDIVEMIQKNLNYQPLEKVDPNTQEIKDFKTMSPNQKLAQAAVPAVLAAMIKCSDDEKGIAILSGNNQTDLLATIYNGKDDEAVKQVAEYASVSAEDARQTMSNISAETIKVVKDQIKDLDAEKFRTFMNAQRHSVLSHLPAALGMGDILNEETFDDRTNKMEGPVSGFLHRIEDKI
jgi:hypothetical protein